MKIESKYICDRCGTLCGECSNTLTSMGGCSNTLAIIFQRPYENLGSAHFCDKCKEEFKVEFKRFAKLKTMVNKQGWKSMKLL